jgi:chaperonin cofactor prefoldin
MKDTTMQHVTDVAIVPEATAEFIAGLLERIEQLESDLATAEQDSRQKQARIERLEQALKAMTKVYKSVPYAQWPTEMHFANEVLEKSK